MKTNHMFHVEHLFDHIVKQGSDLAKLDQDLKDSGVVYSMPWKRKWFEVALPDEWPKSRWIQARNTEEAQQIAGRLNGIIL